MIHFITGKINSYKTTRLLELYQDHLSGDGFAMIKTMQENIVKHYHLQRLSTKEKSLFVIRQVDLTDDFHVACQIGPYLFNQDVLVQASKVFDQLIKEEVSPLFLDEVGVLELENSGFSQILKNIVSSGLDAYLVVRTDLVEEVVKSFQIKEYVIL